LQPVPAPQTPPQSQPPAPNRAAPPQAPPQPPAPSPEPPKRVVDDPFSVEEIEAEFARLLGRPADKGE
jgi:hypothetical protein